MAYTFTEKQVEDIRAAVEMANNQFQDDFTFEVLMMIDYVKKGSLNPDDYAMNDFDDIVSKIKKSMGT
jgi:hypothetical protein